MRPRDFLLCKHFFYELCMYGKQERVNKLIDNVYIFTCTVLWKRNKSHCLCHWITIQISSSVFGQKK